MNEGERSPSPHAPWFDGHVTTDTPPTGVPSTVGLQVESEKEQSLIEAHLQPRYTVRTDERFETLVDVDLVLVDCPTFDRLSALLDRLADASDPVFLPVVLLSGDGDVREDPSVWSTVDDVLETPVRKTELTARVESLLDHRARSLQLEAKNRRIAQQKDQLDAFASDVAHDVRNPLEIAESHVEQLRSTRDSPHLDEIERSLERIDRIVEETLRAARGGLVVADPSPVDVGETATRAWNTVATSSGTLRVEDDLGTVTADPERLRTVFENLFRNAVDHAGASVGVTIGSLPGGFYVADDGPGIPESDRGDVFSLGFTTRDDGTGRGLGIVKRIVEAHGWEIAVRESRYGGARFEILTGDC